MTQESSPRLLDAFFTSDDMRGVFSDGGRLAGMLRFEAALAAAEARAGVIPNSAVAIIESQCRADLFDVETLGRATALAGNPAIPLVKELTARVAALDKAAANYVHFGATSQDAMDTGLILQLRAALDLIETDLTVLSGLLSVLAEAHKQTPMAGRTWMQQAVPITFGLKVAGWLSAIDRHRARMREMRPRVLVLQLGGAAGTLAALGKNGLQVAEALGRELGLPVPDAPWHAHRDRIAEFATTLGLLVGTLGKIARDISLLMQNEIAEVFEPEAEGRGGSSAMPQKHNPVGSAAALSAAIKVPALVSVMLTAMVQENERGLGNWHAEWETLPEICLLTAGALQRITQVLEGLKIDAAQMAKNLEVTGGQIYAEAVNLALARQMEKSDARKLVEECVQQAAERRQHLREVLSENARVRRHLSVDDLKELFKAENYLGSAEALVERVLRNRSR